MEENYRKQPKSRQLSVCYIDREISTYLENAIPPYNFVLALREVHSSRIGTGVVLLCDSNNWVRFAARVERKRRADDLRSLFNFEDMLPVHDLNVDQLKGQLMASQHAALSNPGGALTYKAADRVMEFIQRKDPSLASTISEWRNRNVVKPKGSSETIFEQRDATAMLFRMAGLKSPLTDPDDPRWEIREMQRTYLTEEPREDPAIIADASSFLGWRAESVDGFGVGYFSDGSGSTLSIVNVNRQPSESTSGADLVYHHVQRKSFVHVQYKRMLRKPTSSGDRWMYDPDEHFPHQLKSLIDLDLAASLRSDSRDFRLSTESGYFKFTMMDDYGPGDAALVPGHYMSASLLSSLADTRGGGVGRLHGDDNTIPYITNTLFADLVGYGLIGTRGVGHQDMQRIVQTLAATKCSVALGVHSDLKSSRRSRDRETVPVEALGHLSELLGASSISEHLPGLGNLGST